MGIEERSSSCLPNACRNSGGTQKGFFREKSVNLRLEFRKIIATFQNIPAARQLRRCGCNEPTKSRTSCNDDNSSAHLTRLCWAKHARGLANSGCRPTKAPRCSNRYAGFTCFPPFPVSVRKCELMLKEVTQAAHAEPVGMLMKNQRLPADLEHVDAPH